MTKWRRWSRVRTCTYTEHCTYKAPSHSLCCVAPTAGLCFLAEHAPDEIYTCTRVKFGEEVKTVPVEFPSYPFLIVNIGSGVSIIKVDGPDTFERVSGTALGGGTMFGLARMLTGAESFEDAMQLAEGGDAKHVNQVRRQLLLLLLLRTLLTGWVLTVSAAVAGGAASSWCETSTVATTRQVACLVRSQHRSSARSARAKRRTSTAPRTPAAR